MHFLWEIRDFNCGLFISLHGSHIGRIHCERRIGRMSDMHQFLSRSFLRIWRSRPSQILRQQYIHRFKNGKNAPHRRDNLLDIILQLGIKLQTPLTITQIIILSLPNCLLVKSLHIASNQSPMEKGMSKWVYISHCRTAGRRRRFSSVVVVVGFEDVNILKDKPVSENWSKGNSGNNVICARTCQDHSLSS